MIRLNIIAEGQTEETFVNQVLREPLSAIEIFVSVRCVETSRDKKRRQIYRGGLLEYDKARKDLLRWMKEDQKPDAWFTTMFDLYKLPKEFPDFETAMKQVNPMNRVVALETAFSKDISHQRFLPYIQLHEFEALLLADPSKFDWEFLEHEEAIKRLIALSASYKSPELIDDGVDTAPSKRIIKEIPEYQGLKASVGPLVASKIGLSVLRDKCPHFDSWLKSIESLVHSK